MGGWLSRLSRLDCALVGKDVLGAWSGFASVVLVWCCGGLMMLGCGVRSTGAREVVIGVGCARRGEVATGASDGWVLGGAWLLLDGSRWTFGGVTAWIETRGGEVSSTFGGVGVDDCGGVVEGRAVVLAVAVVTGGEVE